MNFTITSTAFKNNEKIPTKYTCDGENISPPLAWQNSPKDTESYVLLIDDYDAPKGLWNHWLIYNLPKNINNLTEGLQSLPEPAKLGENSYNKLAYDGPCPPRQEEHTYYFKLFALDGMLQLHHKATRANIEKVIKHHILGEAILTGIHKRQMD